MLKQLVAAVVVLFFYKAAAAQSLPQLSKLQMYADFDTLTKYIREISPQTPVRKKVTGFDLNSALAQLRTKVEHSNSALDFGLLVRKAITYCQDGHTSLIPITYYQSEQEFKGDGISTEAAGLLPLYDSLLRITAIKPFNLRLKYIGGEYYTIGDFEYKNRKFPSGLRITKCDKTNVHDYVQKLLGDVRMLRWDFENKRYYAENFFSGYNLKKEDSLNMTFKDRLGRLTTVNFYMSDTLNYEKDNYQQISFNTRVDTFKTVEYFPKEKILYIRVPRMTLEFESYYSTKIKQEGRRGPLQKVIIDIRNNPGGADNVWTTILKNVSAQPISYENVLLCNNSNLIKTKLLNDDKARDLYRAPFLDLSNYITFYKGKVVLQPDSNSIAYKGNIYVIQDENIYSSAGSFTAVGLLAPNIVTVGNNTGRLLGRGINPLVFELPNSKILYRLEPVIDFMNVKDAEDIFHDRVEIPVRLSVDDYVSRAKSNEPIYSRGYLIKKDPVFRKILSLP